LPALQGYYQAVGVTLMAQPTDVELTLGAQRRGWRATRQAFPGTLGVINPPALIRALTPILAERTAAALTITTTEDCATFTVGTQHYRVAAPGPLAALLFGGETEEAHSLPPCGGPLAQVLRTVFPLPLLWQGYNYV
jgi:hypothetical protein